MKVLATFAILRALSAANARNEIGRGSIQNASTMPKLLIGTMMDVIQPVIFEKVEFDYRWKSLLIALFGAWEISFNEQTPGFDCWFTFSNCKLSTKVLKKLKPGVLGKWGFENWIESILRELCILIGLSNCNSGVGELLIFFWQTKTPD